MNKIRHEYKGKPFIEIYEYLQVSILPITIFQISMMAFSQLMYMEGTIILLISVTLYLLSDEYKILKLKSSFYTIWWLCSRSDLTIYWQKSSSIYIRSHL